MPHPSPFVANVARLVWLLTHRPSLVGAQKEALRSAIAAGRTGRHVISRADIGLALASGTENPFILDEALWLQELAARMAGHSVRALAFTPAVKAADLLGVARVLATPPVAGDDGQNFDARTLALRLTTVSVTLGHGGFVRRPTPIAVTRAIVAEPTPPPRASGDDRGRERGPNRAIVAGDEREGARGGESGGESGGERGGERGGESGIDRGSDQRQLAEAAFASRSSADAVTTALRRLEGRVTPDEAAAALDVLLRRCEDLARVDQWEAVTHLLHRVVTREAAIADADVKRAFGIHVRRVASPSTMRGLARLLAVRRELRPALESIFVRTGGEGAEALVEQLIASNVTSERRALRHAIARCPSAAPLLMHLMGDTRWYVVRNAVELLGELGSREAEAVLVGALGHSDARVRRSAVAALARIGTARGMSAVPPLLADTNAAVRLQAAHAIAAARHPRGVPALVQALEREADPEVQHALVKALGANPTDEAVERLVRLAQPGRLLARRSLALRLAAVQALGAAGTHAAKAALRQLQRDRDREVQSAAERALAERAQGALAGR